MATTSSSTIPVASQTPFTSNPNFTNNVFSSSASLYQHHPTDYHSLPAVYTFLATLVLLIAISALVITRTFVLRRRQRLLIEEAIRNGTYVPPPTGQPKVKVEKPVLWDVYLEEMVVGDGGSSAGDRNEKEKEEEGLWDEGMIQPVAVTKRSLTEPPPTLPLPTSQLSWAQRYLPPIWSFRHHEPEPEKPTSPNPDLSSTDQIIDDESLLEVVCLVQMPCASQLKRMEAGEDDEDEGVPVVEFGILQARSGKDLGEESV
ncbi:hypothetical protein EIP91_004062 [Steccherinum ochraceum]|uniref:Uncharacterized protein n=1 Tax=Steccherinum ochraceum TaxID=92696 RepID=A0A4R0RKZ0_9APHY|nr:hypothetical protein EIP91_004062 [Steccherinum ochraceum]